MLQAPWQASNTFSLASRGHPSAGTGCRTPRHWPAAWFGPLRPVSLRLCPSTASAPSPTGPTRVGSSSQRSPPSTARTSSSAASAARTGWQLARTPPTSSGSSATSTSSSSGTSRASSSSLPGVASLLGLLYVVLHFAGTAAALTWVHRRRPHAFPFLRTTLIVSTALALVGYVLYPAAPAAPRRPRLRGHGHHPHRAQPELRPARQLLQPDRGRPEPALRLLADRRRRDRAARLLPLAADRRRRLPRRDAPDHRRHGQPLHLRRRRRCSRRRDRLARRLPARGSGPSRTGTAPRTTRGLDAAFRSVARPGSLSSDPQTHLKGLTQPCHR